MEKSNVTSLVPKDKKSDNTSVTTSLSPREIVSELDRFVVGQNNAKRAVAIALRNRWRRQALTGDMKDEVLPKNILMIGPTGVGKTEISRRLSKLAQAPFIKVEATRFTEGGYVGKDVEQIIRDLIEIAIAMEKEKSFIISGTGDVLEPEDGIIGIGSGGNYALAAAKVLMDSDMSAEEIAKKSLKVASEICVFTNGNVTTEKV